MAIIRKILGKKNLVKLFIFLNIAPIGLLRKRGSV